MRHRVDSENMYLRVIGTLRLRRVSLIISQRGTSLSVLLPSKLELCQPYESLISQGILGKYLTNFATLKTAPKTLPFHLRS